jgi:hypothetical protein
LNPQSIPLLLGPHLGLLLLEALFTPLLPGQLLILPLFRQPQIALLSHPLLFNLPILLLLYALPRVFVFHGDSCRKGTDCTGHALCGSAHK